jgi:glyoxylase-like metal-dependent hydrolase (beta-lactamase superfamily II)
MRSAHFDAAEARPVGLRAAVTSRVGACCGVPRRRGQHLHAVETKIFDALPDETWVYPGHGNDTSLGAERPHLPEWHARGW